MPLRLALISLLTILFFDIGESRAKKHGWAYPPNDNTMPKGSSEGSRRPAALPEEEESSQMLPDSGEDYPAESEEDRKEPAKDCPSCGEAKLSDVETRRLRIEKIKQTILHKLRLNSRPNITMSRDDLPIPLSHGEIGGSQSDYSRATRVRYDYYGRTEHVIIFPDEKSIPCHPKRHHPAECLHFPQATDFPEGNVFRAELWVYKLPDDNDYQNQTFVIKDLSKRVRGPKRRYYRSSATKQRHATTVLETTASSGWTKFDVKNEIKHWEPNPHFEHWLEVVCRSCVMNSSLSPISRLSGQRPFLVISMDNDQERQRNKRNVDCESDTSQCCRESLFISFAEIGWDDWILQPRGYEANYCRGSCMEDVAITMSGSHHTTVMQRYVQKKNLTPDEKFTLTPCCTPTHMSEISLLYIAEAGTVVHKILPDMAVEACGCS